MLLHKTQKARDVLTANSIALSQSERRILILCDGRRDRATIVRMLGDEAAASITVLIEQGYLDSRPGQTPMEHAGAITANEAALKRVFGGLLGGKRRAPVSPDAPAFSDAMGELPRSAGVSAMGAASAIATAVSEVAAAPVRMPTTARRSVSAAKMYMLDMLQLQRSLEASSIAVSIQTSVEERYLVWSILEGLRHLHSVAKFSVCERIYQRLHEILPEQYLTALDTTWSDLLPLAAPATEQAPSNVIKLEQRVA